MSTEQGARWIVRILLVAAAALGGFGVYELATAPAELPMRADGWFESVERHTAATSLGTECLVGGAMLAFGALLVSRRARNLELLERSAAAVGRGLSRGMAAPRGDTATRLAQLDELRTRGLVSDAEHARKRQQIVDEL